MGCLSSKHARASAHVMDTLDDSVNVMMTHDKKVQAAKGQAPHVYKPRAENTMPKPKPKKPQEPVAETTAEKDDAWVGWRRGWCTDHAILNKLHEDTIQRETLEQIQTQ